MKKLGMMWCMIFLIAAASHAQSVRVESDQALNTDFSQYKTFYWASQVDSWLDEGFYFMNDIMVKAQIRDAVKGEMMGLGYDLQSRDPDLIVNFRIFEKPVTIKGFEGYGVGYWGDEKYRQISDTREYQVEAGTLFVSLADHKTGSIVWQGFASGLLDNNAFVKDEGRIREAVNMIFNEYDQRAREYTRK